MAAVTTYRGFELAPNTSAGPGTVQFMHPDYCCPECDPRYGTAADEAAARAEIDEICELHDLDSEGRFGSAQEPPATRPEVTT